MRIYGLWSIPFLTLLHHSHGRGTLHLHQLIRNQNADQNASFMKAMPAKSRTDSENDSSYHFDKVVVEVGICVKVWKICLKASLLPQYFCIMLCILHHIHFSQMPVTLSWKQGIIFLLGNEYNGSLSKHYQVCTHENLKHHAIFFCREKMILLLNFSLVVLVGSKYVKRWPTFGTISKE